MHILLASEALSQKEYGCDLRRLFPWKGVAETPWGSAIARVAPLESTTRHAHDENETFLIIRGSGLIEVGSESSPVSECDVIFLPPLSSHTIKNTSPDTALEFLTIWWDSASPTHTNPPTK